MPDRDLDITKFSYFAYRKLKKTLGEFDAVVECNEIAIREFLEQAEKEDAQKYIQQLSAKHHVRVDEVDFFKFTNRIRQYYVSSAFQQAEQFLKDFKKEWKEYHPEIEWDDLSKGETGFQNIVRNLKLPLDSDIVEVYEYYRLIRNYMSHTDRDVEELKLRFKKITLNKNNFLKKLNLGVTPNPYEEVNFDDFLILTNIIKHIAYLLSVSSKPNNDKIAQILFEKSREDKNKAYKGLKKLKNNEIRYEKAIKSFIKSIFGRFSVADEKEVVDRLKSLLA